RTLLIRLALDPGHVVPSAQLVEAVWEEEPPDSALNALQALVSRLRRILPGAIRSHPSGYELSVPSDAIDAERFGAIAEAGREQLRPDPRAAAAALREALALWRGPALADVSDAAFARAPAARLDELRLRTTEDAIDAELSCGQTDSLVAELDALV